jgi:hypothetical protein
MSETLDNVNVQAKRPTFLTVLCILTFIGSGLGVLGGLLGLIGSSALAMFAPAGGAIIWSVLALIGAALCLFGAIQMWGLKKSGFTMYLLGSLVSIVVAIINAATFSSVVSSSMPTATGEYAAEANAMADSMAGAAGAAVWTSTIISIIITIVFVLMYNANRKHLTR